MKKEVIQFKLLMVGVMFLLVILTGLLMNNLPETFEFIVVLSGGLFIIFGLIATFVTEKDLIIGDDR